MYKIYKEKVDKAAWGRGGSLRPGAAGEQLLNGRMKEPLIGPSVPGAFQSLSCSTCEHSPCFAEMSRWSSTAPHQVVVASDGSRVQSQASHTPEVTVIHPLSPHRLSLR